MRDPARIKRILNKIETAWLEAPDLRFGQFVENICFQLDPTWLCHYQWDLEDDQFEKALDCWIKTNAPESGWKS